MLLYVCNDNDLIFYSKFILTWAICIEIEITLNPPHPPILKKSPVQVRLKSMRQVATTLTVFKFEQYHFCAHLGARI